MPRPDSGFTLLEVLIATTITALLLMTTYGIFSALSRNQQRLQQQAEYSYLSRVLFDHLGRELRTVIDRPGVEGMVFQGESSESRMSLTLCTSSGTTDEGIVRVHYELRPEQGETFILVRSETPLLQQDDRVHRVKLAGGIGALRLRFADSDGWRDTWQSESQIGLPSMVEVTLEMPSKTHPVTVRTAFEVAPLQTP